MFAGVYTLQYLIVLLLSVFAFGIVPAGALELALEAFPGLAPRAATRVVATARSTTVPGTKRRFFVAELPSDNCGVEVYDVTDGRHVGVGDAPSYPSDGPPCHHPRPGALVPPTTAPH